MPTTGPPSIELRPARTCAVLLGVTAVLATAHLTVVLLDDRVGAYRGSEVIFRVLNMDNETNIPAWYSAALLLGVAVLSAITWRALPRARRSGRPHWAGLAAIFVFLSIDEGVLLHEEVSRPLVRVLGWDADRWGYWAWVIPYTLLALLVAASYLRFLVRLPDPVRALMVGAGALYVGAAAGLELVGRELFDPDDITTTYFLVVGVEETLEMVAVILFTYALLRHLRDHVGPVGLRWGGTVAAPRPDPADAARGEVPDQSSGPVGGRT